MIKSMTGFGKAVGNFKSTKLVVEIKGLNSKQADFNVKLPQLYKEKDMLVRNLLLKTVKRGKVELVLHVETSDASSAAVVNQPLAVAYYTQFKEIANQLGENGEDLLPMAIRMPEVIAPAKTEIDEQEWEQILKVIEEAIQAFDAFRINEGNKLAEDFELRVSNINALLTEVADQDANRIEKIKERISKTLQENLKEENIDQNRFEQELIYYLEKLDISEEKVRLATHCDYFLETLHQEETQGKKLGFIGQEMGREINTIGSKANDAAIQKQVVQMKDELEKIKEQVLNIL